MKNLLKTTAAAFIGVLAVLSPASPAFGAVEKKVPLYEFDQFHEEWHLWQKHIAAMSTNGEQGKLRINFTAPGKASITEKDRLQKLTPGVKGVVVDYVLHNGSAMLRAVPSKTDEKKLDGFYRRLQPGANRVEVDFNEVMPAKTVIESIELKSDEPGTVVELIHCDAVLACNITEGIDVDVDTGSPLHIVTPDQVNDKLRLKLVNRTATDFDGAIHADITSFFGHKLSLSQPVKLAAGETLLLPVAAALPVQGAWVVNYRMSAANSPDASGRVRFAVFEPVGVSEGRGNGFLFGAHTHAQTTPRSERDLEFYSAALIGIKILRLDVAWCVIEGQKGVFDFAPYDEWFTLFEKYNME
ncbi:MAG: hypothetical protein PHI35_09580, partial [Victivallaceae bacterium]|nr:hypothetical protein [Victivallaceae bacterium]